MKKQNTKHSLIMSAISLLLCFSMLLGTTFAWFTDSVTSTGNKIQSGTLKVDLELLNKENGTWASIKESKAPIFDYANWEPGYVDAKVFKIDNEGSLALKWMAKFVSANELSILADVIDVYVLPYGVLADDSTVEYPTRELAGYTKVGTVREFVNTIEQTTNGTLLEGQSAYLGIALKMQESAGNDYQNKTIAPFDIQIVATQLESEFDSFGNDYDEESTYPKTTTTAKEANVEASVNAGNVEINIPADALAGNYELTVANTSVDVDASGVTTANFDINLTRDGQSVNNDGTEFTVTVKVAAGITKDSVKVLHKGQEITVESVDTVAGTVTFKTDSFSPYAITYKVACNMLHDATTNTYNVFTADGMMEVNQKFAKNTAGRAAKIKLYANIDMSDKVWETVDSHVDSNSYLAELDGQGFTVSNMKINGQAMFRRFAGSGNVTIKNITFDRAIVDSGDLNTSILTVQAYQNVLLDNVDVKNSSITGTYKVAPLIATVYNESPSTITATLKNCDVSNTTVTATLYDFFTCGMVSFVYTTDNDKIEYENCSVTNVKLRAVNVYNYHANIHYTADDTDDQINEHPGVKVTNVTFENI